MDSSDDSFAWSNASSDSFDSDRMGNGNNAKDHCDDESESGKSYKQKLKKQLFLNSKQCTDELNGQSHVTPKNRKIKKEDAHDLASRSKHIKVEPESDMEISKKKKKSKYKDTTNVSADYQESNDESFLNLKVKEEQLITSTLSASACRQHSNVSIDSDKPESELSDSLVQKSKKKKKKQKREQESDDAINENSSNNHNNEFKQDDSYKKHKKKMKSRNKSSLISNEAKDEFCAEDTVIGTVEVEMDIDTNTSEALCDATPVVTGKKGRKKYMNQNSSIHIENNVENFNQKISEHHIIEGQASSKNKRGYEINSISNNMNDEGNDNLFEGSNFNENSYNLPDKTNQRTSKISDRLTFEDDNDSELETSHNCFEDNVQSTKLKHFLQNNSKLRQVAPAVTNDLLHTHDDEIWILKCPSEVNIEALKGANLKLDLKCKIKVEGQTFEGNIEGNASKIPVVTVENGKFITKSIPLNGIIHLCKRIPKAHFLGANFMVNNQTNFIPLPETKCRHPLFGLNYKKAIKIPSAVAQRLKQCDEDSKNQGQSTQKKRKKSKKHKNHAETFVDAESVDIDIVDSKCEPLTETVVSKKRKHKLPENHIPPAKKKKLNKYNPDSAEGWESEKAIEKNLFDF